MNFSKKRELVLKALKENVVHPSAEYIHSVLQKEKIVSAEYIQEIVSKYFNIDKVRNGEAEYSYYCNDTNAIPDHAVTIVGWDDNYPKENFNSKNKFLASLNPSINSSDISLFSFLSDDINNNKNDAPATAKTYAGM